MKLIYTDPNCYGALTVKDCDSMKEIESVLADAGIEKDTCDTTVHWVFVDKKGKLTQGKFDWW